MPDGIRRRPRVSTLSPSTHPTSASGTAPILKGAACRSTLGAIPTNIVLPWITIHPMRLYRSVLMDARGAQAMRPTSRTWSADRVGGFTLIEMMAVMLIIAMVAALVVTMTPGTGRAQLKALALETAALFGRERLGGVLTGRSRRVSIDGELRSLIGDGGDVVPIPHDVVVNILGVDEEWSGR